MTLYRGIRTADRSIVTKQTSSDQPAELLNVRSDLVNHSPDGFNWGYAGSSPAQLALALLADASNDVIAVAAYQRFKTDHVARWNDHTFDLSKADILEWLDQRGYGAQRIEFIDDLEKLAAEAKLLKTKYQQADQQAKDTPEFAAYEDLTTAVYHLEYATRILSRPGQPQPDAPKRT